MSASSLSSDPGRPARGAAPVASLPVHVVVLAAGRGSRLGHHGEERPKWLLPVAGRTIADRHLEGIAAAGDVVSSVSVVVGHAAEAIEQELADRGMAGDVRVVGNPEYLTRNNWWSVLRAMRELPAGAPVVLVNSDLMLPPEQVTAFLLEAAAGTADGLLAVDLQRMLTDESMKVSRNPDGTLAKIGKVGIDDPQGEFIGLSMSRGPVLAAFRERLESWVDVAEHDDEWYEGAIGAIAAEGVAWNVWPTPTSDWVEIDDDADLALAEGLAGGG